jgi:hypothetical protein
MPGLPSPQSLSLSEALGFVMRRCDCTKGDAKRALREAGLDGKLLARGEVPLSAHPDIRRAAAHPVRTLQELSSSDWANEIDWEHNRIGRYFDVHVMRASIEAWLDRESDVETSNTVTTPEITVTSIEPSNTANNISKPSPFRGGLEEEYKALQNKSLKEKGRGTTVSEDQKWCRGQKIARRRMRELRRTCRPPESRKGGAPRKRPPAKEPSQK